jgi:hypothetical protein
MTWIELENAKVGFLGIPWSSRAVLIEGERERALRGTSVRECRGGSVRALLTAFSVSPKPELPFSHWSI